MSPVSKKQQASVNKYIKEKYDTFRLTFPKGKKAELQDHAKARDESLNAFVNRAIDNQVAQDNAVAAFTVPPTDGAEVTE
jgi:predicted HicB family RNase H-like nuclease